MSAADPDKPEAHLPAFKPREALALSMPQREAVIEQLTRAFAEDAITMDEFERRAELAYRAASMADLQVLVSDLPSEPPTAAAVTKKGKGAPHGSVRDRITTWFGSTERGMPGVMPHYLRVRTFMGNTELDFRQSTFEPGVTEVNIGCLMGNVELTVPEGIRVEMYCASVLANVGMADKTGHDLSFENGEAQARVLPRHDASGTDLVSAGGAPSRAAPAERVLRITGRVVFGNVEVHRGSLRREP